MVANNTDALISKCVVCGKTPKEHNDKELNKCFETKFYYGYVGVLNRGY